MKILSSSKSNVPYYAQAPGIKGRSSKNDFKISANSKYSICLTLYFFKNPEQLGVSLCLFWVFFVCVAFFCGVLFFNNKNHLS